MLTLLVAAMAAEVPEARAAGPWQAWVADPLTRVQPTSPVGGSTAATLKAARNEYEAVQLVVRAPDAAGLSGVNVSVSDLVGPATIAKSNIALYRAHYVPVRTSSSYQGVSSPYPPGDWPDALVPSTTPGGTYPSFPFPIAAGKNQPIYVEVYVPKGTPAGTYTGTLTVTATGQTPITVPLTLTIWGFTLPDRTTLASEFWGYDRWLSIDYKYSTGADRVTLLKNLQTDLRQHRIGFETMTTTGPYPNAADDAVLQRQARGYVASRMTDANLQAIVKAYGPQQLYAQHHDETNTIAGINAINDPNGEAQRYRTNGVPELLTVTWSPERINGEYVGWSADVDIYAVIHNYLSDDFSDAQKKLDAGKAVWSYTTGIGRNGNPHWNIDFDVNNFRIVPWLDYSTGLTGFLYWTPVNWCAGDPWTDSGGSGSNPCNTVPNTNGRGLFYYPGHKVGAPNAAIPSARLKAIRDGVEDYEYLALLASLGDPAKAKALSRTLAPAWNDWNHDPAALLAAREQAAARIVQLGGGSGGEDGGGPDAGPDGSGTDAGLDASGGAGLDAGDSARAHVDANIDVGCALSRRRPSERGLWPVAGLALALGLGRRRARGRRGDVDT